MRSSSLVSIALSLVLAAACDTYPASIALPEPSEPATPEPVDTIDTAGVVLPGSLTCVSNPLGDTTDVLRVQVATTPEGGAVSLQRGPQFWSHGGVWTEPGTTDVRDVHVTDGRLVQTDGMGLEIALTRDGNVLRGTLVDDQPHPRVETSLTCWNDLELFGSPWAGVPGALDATFDWSTGTCFDSDGDPALNDVPIEVVRETGQGACADLRGEALNGADYSGPDLSGWNLVGARLDGARLFFAQLDYASLNGAKLADLDFGYATITGSIDAHTELPDACETQTSPWSGSSASCVQ